MKTQNSEFKIQNSKKGFTLIETLITMVLLGMFSIFIVNFFINTSNFQNRISVNKELTDEMRDIIEKVVREVRKGMIDYKGYYIYFHNDDNFDPNRVVLFYDDKLPMFFPNGEPNPETFLAGDDPSTNKVDELMILAYDGNSRVKFRNGVDGRGYITREKYMTVGTCALEIDGTAIYPNNNSWDTGVGDPCWVTDSDFPITAIENYGWQPFSSEKIEIETFSFFISPNMDPWKVYKNDNIQLQPHVTILLTAKMRDEYFKGVTGKNKSITIQTTISSRLYDSVEWTTP